MKLTWTVYTVDESDTHDGKFDILAVKWTEEGPRPAGDARVVSADIASRAEAEVQAAQMQRSYDETRRVMNA